MKCMCRSSESATARMSASSCSHAPMSQRYWRWYTGTTMVVSAAESQAMVLTAVASMFVAVAMVSLRPSERSVSLRERSSGQRRGRA